MENKITARDLLIVNGYDLNIEVDRILEVVKTSFLFIDDISCINIVDFWNYLKFVFSREDIMRILDISTTTYYKLDKTIINNDDLGISDKLFNSIKKLRLIIEKYIEEII